MPQDDVDVLEPDGMVMVEEGSSRPGEPVAESFPLNSAGPQSSGEV